MRAELEQKIQEARERLGLGALTAEQRAEQERTQAMDEFKIFLAGRIEPWTRAELLMGAEYFWEQTGSAVRFGVDNHVFLLTRCGDDAGLFVEEAAGNVGNWSVWQPMTRSSGTGCWRGSGMSSRVVQGWALRSEG
jgi:hypothetical protein